MKEKTKKSTKKKVVEKPAVTKANDVSNEMYFKVGRVDFTNAVNLVGMALSKDYNDAKSGIMMEAKYDKDVPMLYMTANSLDVFIRHGIKLSDDIEEGFVVPNGAFITRLVRNLKAMKNPLEFSIMGDELQITCGTDYSGVIQHYDPIGFVTPPSNAEIKKFNVLSIQANVIKLALDKVAFSCSKDMAIPNLTAVLIEQKDDGMIIIGTDGKRFSYLKFNAKVRNPKSVIIGVRYLQTLKSIIEALGIKESETLDMYMSDDKLYMVAGNTTVGIQIYGGTHPIQDEGGYGQFVIPEKSCAARITIDREKFMPVLGLAIATNGSSRDTMRMRLNTNGSGVLEDSDSSDNQFQVEFNMEMKSAKPIKKPIIFDFSPDLLIDAVNAINDKAFSLYIVELEDEGKFFSAGNMVILRPAAKDVYEYLHVFSLN